MPSVIPKAEIDLIRKLASRVRTIGDSDEMKEKARLWTAHNDLDGERPMVLIEVGGIGEELPIHLTCKSELGQQLERGLRHELYYADEVGDDKVIQPYLSIRAQAKISDYGVQVVDRKGEAEQRFGSRVWDAPLKNLPEDIAMLHPRTLEPDPVATERIVSQYREILGDALPVRVRGAWQWTQGMTISVIRFIGLQELMMFMYDQPEGLHELMAFMRDDHLAFNARLEAAGLLTLNNEGDYVGSGSQGWTTDLPAADYVPGQPARLRDLWCLSESQETVGVSPQLFEEFIFQYQQPVAEQFGLCYYGCCEPVHTRWHVLKRLKNLRKVSVSPWCDQEFMAEALGQDYCFARKPNPTLISCQKWDEDAILEDIRETCRIAGNCNLEFAMKDVHTVANQPWRLRRWVELAYQGIDDVLG